MTPPDNPSDPVTEALEWLNAAADMIAAEREAWKLRAAKSEAELDTRDAEIAELRARADLPKDSDLGHVGDQLAKLGTALVSAHQAGMMGDVRAAGAAMVLQREVLAWNGLRGGGYRVSRIAELETALAARDAEIARLTEYDLMSAQTIGEMNRALLAAQDELAALKARALEVIEPFADAGCQCVRQWMPHDGPKLNGIEVRAWRAAARFRDELGWRG